MGLEIETPVSEAVAAGYDAFVDFIERRPLAVAVWLRLIFIKTHLRDREMRFHLDARKGSQKIGELYPWEQLHFTHTFARCFHSDCLIPRAAYGTAMVLRAERVFSQHRFDFADNFVGETMLLRFDDVAILTVFDDCGGVNSLMENQLDLITAPLSDAQLRELFVEMAWLNMHLKDRPTLGIEIDPAIEMCRITCNLPPRPELIELDYALRGRLYHQYLGDLFRGDNENLDAIKAGRFTLLFDRDGKFIDHAEATAQPET
jgi:hypothetical protein